MLNCVVEHVYRFMTSQYSQLNVITEVIMTLRKVIFSSRTILEVGRRQHAARGSIEMQNFRSAPLQVQRPQDELVGQGVVTYVEGQFSPIKILDVGSKCFY